MFSLFRSELFQIRKNLAVKILFLFVIITSVFLGIQEASDSYAAEYKEIGRDYINYGSGNLLSSMNDYPLATLLASLLAGWMVSQSFENRTIQEAVSYGKSRTKIYIVKIIMYFIVSIFTCLAMWTAGSIFVFMKNGIGTQEITGNLCRWDYLFGMVFAESLAYLSIFAICGVIAIITKKTSITIGICIIGITLGFTIITRALPESLSCVLNYTPVCLSGQVLKLDVSWNDIIKTSLASIVWIIGISTAGLLKFQKTELK